MSETHPVGDDSSSQLSLPVSPSKGAIAMLAGGSMTVLGSFLPWLVADIGLGKLSVAGTDGNGDGLISLGLGVALVTLALFGWRRGNRRWLGPIASLIGLGTIGLAMYEFDAVLDRGSDFATVSVGIGLWMVLAGGIVAGLGGIAKELERLQQVANRTEGGA